MPTARAVMEDFGFSHGTGHQDTAPVFQRTSFAVFVTMIAGWKLRHGALDMEGYLEADRRVQTREKNGPYFIAGRFARPGRRAEDLVESYAFVADLDKGNVTQRVIEEALDGYCYVAWTTYSHTKAKAKWRVVVPYERVVTRSEHHEAIFEHFQGVFGGVIDEASRRPAQLYYFPGCPRDAVKLHSVASDVEGVFFDPDEIEVVAPVPGKNGSTQPTHVPGKIDDMRSALEHVVCPKEDGTGRYQLWLKVGMALHHESRGSAEGLRAWREWHLAQGYDRDVDECEQKWASFRERHYGAARITGATVFDLARKAGWSKGEVDDAAEHLPVEFSEDNLAHAFASAHAHHLRYVQAWGKWYQWDGAKWAEEKTLLVLDLVRKLCREKASDARTREDLSAARRERIAMVLSQAHTIASVLSLARADRRLATRTDQWDASRYLLNTPEGTVDLRTGQLRAADPADYMTKCTAVAPAGRCPAWDAFLKRVMDGNTELILFLQRLIGYSLTGDVSEHALTFFYGTGGNGKSTFLNTVAALMGEYATIAPSETFIEGRTDRHPTELAMMRGARLVVAQEVEEGKRWAESRVKSLTGGEPVTARFMRQDFFTFEPQFKLVVAGNYKPGLRNVDEAIRRRMHLVPWLVTIPREERDTGLVERLKEEWPGILAWAIEGCLAWQRHGLSAPREIAAATEEYLQQEDQLLQWMRDGCDVRPGLREARSFVYAAYKRWCEESNEFCLPSRRFYDKLETMGGFRFVMVDGVRLIDGIRTKFATAPHLKPVAPKA